MRNLLLCVALTSLLAGCAGSAASGGSGVEGTVQMGPTCPVEHLGTPCTEAWTGTVQATDLSGNIVASARTDPSGGFRLDLDPGVYMVRADTAGQTMPRGIPMRVTVKSGSFTRIVLMVDTGIR
jgi:hypothetical protein